ncbi:hypothetical protein QQZ08_011478 [Neonectria magnoliae]|uniref:Uncharacterized protein n=1 Tax=Neonectria magnoliae TaxID=2732573 RepID=A0ABR1HA71_9HYPO
MASLEQHRHEQPELQQCPSGQSPQTQPAGSDDDSMADNLTPMSPFTEPDRLVRDVPALTSSTTISNTLLELRTWRSATKQKNTIIIINSLCNLDLLYYAAENCPEGQDLYDIATLHARVLLQSHFREERPVPSSKGCYTGPCRVFFVSLETASEWIPKNSRYVPPWDFDVLVDPENPLRDPPWRPGQDELAGRYRRAAVNRVREPLGFAQAPEKTRLVKRSINAIEVEDETLQAFDGILKYSKANNNPYSKRQYANHGLVYGDYYLVTFGSRLLHMNLV